MIISTTQTKRSGLDYWMQQVLDQVDKAAAGLKPDPVHDLRTALRRCRSLADGFTVFDSDPAWKKMKRAGKQLFQSLGALRDTHVLRDWVERLAPDDASKRVLEELLEGREQALRVTAAAALQQFDKSKWQAWTRQLPSRAARVALDSPLFAHLALERWQEAHALHHRALRNRTNVSFHDLRIGVKRFRYTVENFLPSLHEFWAEDLKEVQDALGDVHDLDVLWSLVLSTKLLADSGLLEAWRERVRGERQQHLQKYRGKMVGRDSLWPAWRAALPRVEELRGLGLRRLELWASFLDPGVRHSRHVSELALQLFDGLSDNIPAGQRARYRDILQSGTIMHEVGRSKMQKGHHKETGRLIRKLRPPLGWMSEEICLASLVARYHRGAMPGESQKRFASLSIPQRSIVQFLGGILRFACACDREHDSRIRRVDVECSSPMVKVRAEGYGVDSSLAEHLAAARYLLELAYERPVYLVPSASSAA